MLDGLPTKLTKAAERLVRLGDLSWMLDEHQEELIYDPYRDFEARMHEHEGDGFFNCWQLDAGRQVGKTFAVSLIRVEDCIRNPGSRYMSACGTEISLNEFIIPNIDTIIEYLPDDIRPVYKRNHRNMRAAYWFPNGSVYKLVGLDWKKGKALRGPKCDGCNIHEAAFIPNLAKTVVGVIQPQFQRGRDPTLILESSAPDEPDHDFDEVFLPSCQRRKAYVFLTIDDNTAISEKKKAALLSAAREIDSVDADREYFGKCVRNPKKTVFTAIGAHMMLDLYLKPKYGVALCALDPGQVHQFAINWSIYDVTRGQVVFIDDYAESAPSTERAACIIAAREWHNFATHPNPMLSRIPLDDEYDARGKLRAAGWRTLLAGDKHAFLAELLYKLAQEARGDEISAWSYFDHGNHTFASNPHSRVSDTQLQLINDLANTYGIFVSPTTKSDLRDVMVKHANAKMVQGKVAFAPEAALTYKHCHAAMWNEQRTKFAEHRTYAHFDLAACVIYAMRYWDQLYNILPDPPLHLGKGGADWVGDVVGENRDYSEENGNGFF